MTAFVFVMLGGAVGAALRFGIGVWSIQSFGDAFPWGTLVVNLSGGLLMGLLAGAVIREGAGLPVHLLLGTGLLGGFTTFSAFSLETALLVERGQIGTALAYALASVVGSVLLLFAGLWAGRAAA
ncbi:MAG TPA: fluoride efflux transporter CrcB [Allosphingosinicella sp.]|jgi:CrcB protein|nr:fluoride efflux transporter CrcB [Allosphingosinicella sp.]